MLKLAEGAILSPLYYLIHNSQLDLIEYLMALVEISLIILLNFEIFQNPFL